MTCNVSNGQATGGAPSWLPDSFRLYLEHVEGGLTIRALARQKGCAPSTISRQVSDTEKRRDDPLVDSMLTDLGRLRRQARSGAVPGARGTGELPMKDRTPDDQTLRCEGARVLRALSESGAVMAVTPNVDTAVVVVESEDGRPLIRAKCDRGVAQAMAVKEWISGETAGRVARYRITPTGRGVLNRFMAEDESAALGFAEAPTGFDHARPVRAGKGFFGRGHQTRLDVPRRRGQAVGLESPLRVLARRKDQKTGQMYLSADLVAAGERLQRDFEMAQLDVSGGVDWTGLLARAGQGGARGTRVDRRLDARARFDRAMAAVQPELGDLLLRVCCQECGMEQVETDLAMPQRAGKYMLRIALQYLKRHYDAAPGEDHDLIW